MYTSLKHLQRGLEKSMWAPRLMTLTEVNWSQELENLEFARCGRSGLELLWQLVEFAAGVNLALCLHKVGKGYKVV